MRIPGKPIPVGGTCDKHGMPLIHGEPGCFYCLYTRKRSGKLVPKPERAPAKPKPEPKSETCKGCGVKVDPRCEWCAKCRPGDRTRMARECRRCGKPVTEFYAHLCEGCSSTERWHSRDEAAKMERRARGLKGRKWVQWEGETLSVAEVARRESVKTDAVYRRLAKGLTIGEAVDGARRLG